MFLGVASVDWRNPFLFVRDLHPLGGGLLILTMGWHPWVVGAFLLLSVNVVGGCRIEIPRNLL